MKRVTWVIGVAMLLVAGSTLPVEAASGGGGYHGGGGGYHGGGGGYYGGGSGGYHGGGAYYGGGYHGGGYHGGYYGGTRVYIGGGFGWWGWPGWWGPSYPYYSYPYYADPSVVVQQGPTGYIQQDPAPPAVPQYWYYCQQAGAYYPYIKDCPGGWITVAPSPNPPTP